ncbi:hypothetical protein ACLKMY_23690 [Paraburkholderia mimosarum]|uniref:hypothetical protein n=1 Tax=Paraburkholderia mimosarum TaxID=312026 RepID=UPI0039C087B2
MALVGHVELKRFLSMQMRTKMRATRVKRTTALFIASIIAALFAVVALWYPFGFAMGAMLEDWGFFDLFNRLPDYWASFPGQPLANLSVVRPLQLTPFVVAKALVPHSFAGTHLLLMLSCALKVVASTWIGYFLFRSRMLAVAFGLLVLVFPADTQQMSLRTMNISLAGGVMLAGIATCVYGLMARTVRRRIQLIAASMVLCVIAGLIYEPYLPLYGLPAFLVWARYGTRRTWLLLCRRWRLVTLWLVAPACNAAYLFYALYVFKAAYQTDLAEGGILHSLVRNAKYLWESAAYRLFYESWLSTWRILLTETVRYAYIGGIFVGTLCLLTLCGASCRAKEDRTRGVRTLIIGLVAALLGYLPFETAISHVTITQRTFMGAAPGAALVVIAMISLLSFGKRTVITSIVAALAISLGFVQQLYQFDKYTRAYVDTIRPYTSYLADHADPSRRIHLVLDTSGLTTWLGGMYFSTVKDGANVRRERTDDQFYLCKNLPLNDSIPFWQCTDRDSFWHLKLNDSPDGSLTFDANNVDVIKIDNTFDTRYDSLKKDWIDFSMPSANWQLFRKPDAAEYACHADSMWGYSQFCRGNGWSEGLRLEHQNALGSIAPEASLIFPLTPQRSNYTLTISTWDVDSPIAHAMQTSINGHAIVLERTAPYIWQGSVSPSSLVAGMNTIEFRDVLPTGHKLGLIVTDVTLRSSREAARSVQQTQRPDHP